MIVQRNGRDATAADLAPLAFAAYAHFTAAQVRDGRIRGLDLHLDRLRAGSQELFGRALPDDVVRGHLRTALAAGPADVSLTATVYSSPPATARSADDDAPLDVLVRTGPPATPPAGPLALAVVPYERYLPAVKHVGEVAKTHVLKVAARDGFDDAAFADRHGRLTEASIWNLAFWDGDAVVWPVGDVLGGITMGILRRRLTGLGVPQRDAEVRPADLPALAGAVVMNSWTPGVPVGRIGATPLPAAPDLVAALHDAYAAEPLTAP